MYLSIQADKALQIKKYSFHECALLACHLWRAHMTIIEKSGLDHADGMALAEAWRDADMLVARCADAKRRLELRTLISSLGAWVVASQKRAVSKDQALLSRH